MLNIKHLRKMMERDEKKKLLNEMNEVNPTSSYSLKEMVLNFFTPSTIQSGMSNEETFEKIRAVTKT